MRWINKITDKRAAYDLIERERPHKTLDELGRALNLTRERVRQICKELGITAKPYRLRGRHAQSQVKLVAG